jgi:hypothetical protein
MQYRAGTRCRTHKAARVREGNGALKQQARKPFDNSDPTSWERACPGLNSCRSLDTNSEWARTVQLLHPGAAGLTAQHTLNARTPARLRFRRVPAQLDVSRRPAVRAADRLRGHR